MKVEEAKKDLRNILSAYKIDVICKMVPATYDRFLDFIVYMYNDSTVHYEKKAYIYFAKYSLGILYQFLFYLLRIPSVFKRYDKKTEHIFIPCSEKFIRFKHIPGIMDRADYLIMYFPPFKLKYYLDHLKYYTGRKQNVCFTGFRFKTFTAFLLFMLNNAKKINKLMNELEKEKSLPGIAPFVYIYLCKYVIYDYFSASLLTRLKGNAHKKIWFLDNELSPEYLAFINRLRLVRMEDKTVHIQHGMFWGGESAYLHFLSDYTFTCSLREKQLLDESVNSSNRTFIVGAPLQCFNDYHNNLSVKNTEKPVNNILVLATITSHATLLALQKELISYLEKSNFDFSVRLRPATKEEDRSNLSGVLKESRISPYSSLSESILQAGTVISFSIDALTECFRFQKKTAIFVLKESYRAIKFIGMEKELEEFAVCSDIRSLDSFLKETTTDEYSQDMKKFVIDNFGEPDFQEVKKNYSKAIKVIKEE